MSLGEEKYGGRVVVTLYICLAIIFCLFVCLLEGTSPFGTSPLFWGIALFVAIGYIAFNFIQMARIDKAVFKQQNLRVNEVSNLYHLGFRKCPGCDANVRALLYAGRFTDGRHCPDCGEDLLAASLSLNCSGSGYVSPNYRDK